MRYALRLSLPDRPGALAAVATACARAGADIVRLDVVERVDGIAVDDVCCTADAEPEVVRHALEQVPGVLVEQVRAVHSFPDPGAPVALAARLIEQGTGAVGVLVQGLPEALDASWCAAVVRGLAGPEVLAQTAGAPDLDGLEAPWLPLPAPRRLPSARWMPASWRADAALGGLELAAAPLGVSPAAVLLGRRPGPRYRTGELRALGHLARAAVAAEVAAAGGHPRRGRPRPAAPSERRSTDAVPRLSPAPAGPAATAGRS